jgi:hypothetical protein
VKQAIKYRFQDKEQLESEMQMDFQVVQLFNGQSDPKAHIEQCVTQWQVAEIPSRFWVQVFPHSLGPILKAWFMHEETRRQTNDWKMLVDHFCKDFSFTSKYPELEVVLQRIKEFLFTDTSKQKSDLVVCAKHSRELQTNIHLNLDKRPIECYKIEKDLESPDDLEELRNLAIKETEGNREIQNIIPSQTDGSYNHPLKLCKVNIGTTEKPKIAMVGDYWDEKTSQEIQSLLREYEDLFPKTFSELKGIKGVMGEMKIELKPGSKPVRHRPYCLNPRVKEKVKREIDKMLEAGLIFAVEEAEWVSPIVIQRKKGTEDIRVCVDYKSLNSACVHDPFPTPFTDEVLEQVAGKESYSFTDGFLGYHQVRIVEEDKKKTTFITEWGSFAYNVMPFGLKNAPAVFSRIVIASFREFIHKFIEVYMDDWMVYSLLKEHVALLRLMFDRCRELQISLNLRKCIFCVPHGNLLGHIVCREGVLVDPAKVVVIVNMPATYEC